MARRRKTTRRRGSKGGLLTTQNLIIGAIVAWFFWPKTAGATTTPGAVAPSAAAPAPTLPIEGYVVASGDTLSKLAQRYYGDSALWPKIYAANVLMIGTDPNVLEIGMRLTIPA